MTQLSTLATLEGRAVLRAMFRELRYERRTGSFSAMMLCLRVCIREREIFRYISRDVTVQHSLGVAGGISLWMQEIINRFYFSVISSFVYFGAAILLLVVGLRRVMSTIPDWYLVGSVLLESMMLVVMFVVMFFSPSEEETDIETESTTESELVREIGEIASDYASSGVRLEHIAESLEALVERQDALVEAVKENTRAAALAISPNPQMLEQMAGVNAALAEFRQTLNELNESARSLQHEEIQAAVRHELQRIVTGAVATQPPADR